MTSATPSSRFVIQPGGPGPQRLPYLLMLPGQVGPETPLWVSVHGVTRQPLSHARAFCRPAALAGAALLVPLFSAERQRRYQRLVHPASGRRADLALLQTVEQVRQRHGLPTCSLHLFGYSAGAQFAHRFAMAHPRQVAALAVGAAGWYTWPDDSLPYPLGWGGMARSLGLTDLDRAAFLALPKAVWVGERDDRPDHRMRSHPLLDQVQGVSRVERARRWSKALEAVQAPRQANCGLASRVPVHLVPRAGHDFTACARRGHLAWQVADFFARPRPVERSFGP